MSYIDHQAREINVKVMWLENAENDFAALQRKLWKFRSKPHLQRLSLDSGEVDVLSLRLPPYRRCHGYHVRFHLFAYSEDAPFDESAWKGTDAVVVQPHHDKLPNGVLRVDRASGEDAFTLSKRLSEQVSAALEEQSRNTDELVPRTDDDNTEFIEVGHFPFCINIEGLEASVDKTEDRIRLVVESPNGYDLLVFVYPPDVTTVEETFTNFSQGWGAPTRGSGVDLAGFHFAQAIFDSSANKFKSYEVLAARLRDSFLVLTLRGCEGAECKEELRRYFLTMVEDAVLQSRENRP